MFLLFYGIIFALQTTKNTMKKIILFSIVSLLFFSCNKETFNKTIVGEWYYIEAYETDVNEEEYDLLGDYENITLVFNQDKTFIWYQNEIEFPGTYSKNAHRIKLNFDNGDEEKWTTYSVNGNKNTLSYSYYNNDDSRLKFKLKKVTVSHTRR